MLRLSRPILIASLALAMIADGFAQVGESRKLVAPGSSKSKTKKRPASQLRGSLPEEPFAPMPVLGTQISRTMMEGGSGITSHGGFLYVLSGSMLYKVDPSTLAILQARDIRRAASIGVSNNVRLEPSTKKSRKKKHS